jgi:ribosome biogenesis GTPase / thiamine phosphate phosphatase
MNSFHETSDSPGENTRQGLVLSKTTGHTSVYVNGQILPCELSNRLRKQLVYPTASPHSVRRVVRQVKQLEHSDPLAVGDQVRFIPSGAGGLIVEVLPRRNKLVRRSSAPMPGAHTFEQVLAANLDQVVCVFAAADPAPKWNLLDRTLAAAEAQELPALVCITKLDRVQGPSERMELKQVVETYRSIGYPVILTSAISGEGLESLRAALQGKVSALLGKSGVGKTSLLNALQPGLGLRVNAVSQATGKGRHTTSHQEMFLLEQGELQAGALLQAEALLQSVALPTAIIDTPGVREFGLWEVEADDLGECFPEMRPFLGRCRFGLDCRHDEEPDCAIRKAVMTGQIDPRRYQSYLRLRTEL